MMDEENQPPEQAAAAPRRGSGPKATALLMTPKNSRRLIGSNPRLAQRRILMALVATLEGGPATPSGSGPGRVKTPAPAARVETS